LAYTGKKQIYRFNFVSKEVIVLGLRSCIKNTRQNRRKRKEKKNEKNTVFTTTNQK